MNALLHLNSFSSKFQSELFGRSATGTTLSFQSGCLTAVCY